MPLIRFISVAVLCHLAFVSTRFSVSLYAIDKGASPFTVGVILSLFSVIPVLISVRIGKWIDHGGPLLPTTVGISLTAIGATLPLIFSYETADLAPLLVSASLVGTGFTFSILSMQHCIGEMSVPEKRTIIFSWFAMGVSISGFFGPVLGGIIIDNFSHRTSFILPIGVSLCAACLLFLSQDYDKPKPSSVNSSRRTNPFQLFRYKELRDILVITGLIAMCWDLHNFVIPLHGSKIGLSASKIGFILGAFALATFGIRLLMPLLTKYMTEWQILISLCRCMFFHYSFFKNLLILHFYRLCTGIGARRSTSKYHDTRPLNRTCGTGGRGLRVKAHNHPWKPGYIAVNLWRIWYGIRNFFYLLDSFIISYRRYCPSSPEKKTSTE